MDQIELSIPARPELLFMARLHVGATASLVQMSIEDIEDLHIAVEELCLSLLSTAGESEGRLTVSVQLEDEAIHVTCTLQGTEIVERELRRNGKPPDLAEIFSARILEALVDDHGSSLSLGSSSAWLQKKLVPGP